ncbi:MAG: hypothetical protein F4150_03215 [Chloroflexi bacterium]|nr:hypothetical protein [Chloroflexota bacterium]
MSTTPGGRADGRERPAAGASDASTGARPDAPSAGRPHDSASVDDYDLGEVEPAAALRRDLLLADGAPGAR